MSTIDYLRQSMMTSGHLTTALLDDMKDLPLQAPTSKGGNHPLWVLGHLAYAEANIIEHIIKGNDNPLLAWKETFGPRQEPSTNAEDYPSWDEVRGKFDEMRANTLAFIETLSDADLETPTKNCPEGREEAFGTIGACLIVLSLHPMMHYGQVADARRMADRKPLNG